MPSESSSGSRYIFSLSQVNKAAAELPAANGWPSETYEVEIKAGQKMRKIIFRKIRYKNRDGVKERWVYDGKILADDGKR